MLFSYSIGVGSRGAPNMVCMHDLTGGGKWLNQVGLIFSQEEVSISCKN